VLTTGLIIKIIVEKCKAKSRPNGVMDKAMYILMVVSLYWCMSILLVFTTYGIN